jgi:hypothetical protein
MINNLTQFCYLLHALSICSYLKRYSFSRSNPCIMQAKIKHNMKKYLPFLLSLFIGLAVYSQTGNTPVETVPGIAPAGKIDREALKQALINRHELQIENNLSKSILSNRQMAGTRAQNSMLAADAPPNFSGSEAIQVYDSIITWTILSADDSIYYSKEYINYDSSGNDVLRHSLNWDQDSNKWLNNYKFESRYDRYGNWVYDISYTWDSTWVVSGPKFEYEYDSSGNLISSIWSDWDTNSGTWIGYSWEEYGYNSLGKETLYAYYYWNSNSNTWKIAQKEEHVYDNDGILKNRFEYYWSQGSIDTDNSLKVDYYNNSLARPDYTLNYRLNGDSTAWVLKSKNEMGYDTNGYLVSDSLYSFLPGDSTWEIKSKYIYENDSIGQCLLKTGSDFESDEWVNKEKWEYKYDSAGNVILSAKYGSWEPVGSIWIGSQKSEYEYDSRGNRLVWANYFWDYSMNKWKGTRKIKNEYNDAGRRSRFTYFTWDSEDGSWVGSSDSRYLFDEEQNWKCLAYYNWNSTDSLWSLERRSWYYWSALKPLAVSPAQLTVSAEAGSTADFTVTSGTNWTVLSKVDWLTVNTTSGSNNNTITVTAGANPDTTPRNADIIVSAVGWDTLTVSVTQEATHKTGSLPLENETISLYPNPVGDGIYITGVKAPALFEIMDLNGKIMFSRHLDGENSYITCPNLPKGVYVARISGETVVLKKIIKK